MSRLQRKLLVGGFVATAAVMAVATVGYACVPFKGDGQVNVSDPNGGGGTPQNSGTTTGDGTATNMRFCGNTVTPGFTTAAEGQADGGDVITVSVNTASSPCAGINNKLSQGLHSVVLNNSSTDGDVPFTMIGGSTWSMRAGKGCFTSPAPSGNIILDTAFSVNGSGVGTKTYTLGSMNRVDGTNQASLLCVGQGGANAQGTFVPMKIEATI